jgi:hypothetical protein
VPSANPGAQAAALSEVRTAIQILEKALPGLGTGTEPYTAALNAIKALARHASPSSEIPGQQQTALRNLQANAGRDQGLQQLMRSMGGAQGGAPGGMPGGGPQGMPGMGGGTPPTGV